MFTRFFEDVVVPARSRPFGTLLADKPHRRCECSRRERSSTIAHLSLMGQEPSTVKPARMIADEGFTRRAVCWQTPRPSCRWARAHRHRPGRPVHAVFVDCLRFSLVVVVTAGIVDRSRRFGGGPTLAKGARETPNRPPPTIRGAFAEAIHRSPSSLSTEWRRSKAVRNHQVEGRVMSDNPLRASRAAAEPHRLRPWRGPSTPRPIRVLRVVPGRRTEGSFAVVPCDRKGKTREGAL
jgi:hypothetical protein